MNATPDQPEPAQDDTLDTLPHNIEAEQAFLGAILYENEIWHRVSDFLQPEHFYDPVHGRIYAATVERIASGSVADAIILKTHFERDGGLKEIGGAAYLAILLESASDGMAAIEYAKLIFDLAIRRGLIRIAGEVEREAREAPPEADGHRIIHEAEAQLSDLARSDKRSAKSSSLADAAATVLNDIDSDAPGLAIPTGISDLDRKLGGGLRPGKAYFIGGRPGMGKSVLGSFMQMSTALAGWYSPQFQFEMDAEEVAERMLSFLCTRDKHLSTIDWPTYEEISLWRNGDGKPIREQREALQRAVERLRGISAPVIDAAGMTMPQIEAYALRAYREAEARGLKPGPLGIDYLQLVSAHTRRGDSKTAEVTDIADWVKQMARRLKVPVIALSQLSRGLENRTDKRPQLGDLRESGAIEQNADVVIGVYREAHYAADEKPPMGGEALHDWEMRCADRTMELLIRKNRGGRKGTVLVNADMGRNLIENKAREFEEGRR